MGVVNLSGASINLTAFHFDAELAEGWHEHTWTITAWWPPTPWRDGRAMAGALRTATESLVRIDDEGRRCLPVALWSNEAVARTLLVLANVVRIDVDRPPEGDKPGFHARFYA